MKKKNVLFLLSGSIAAYKACEVISQLVQRGYHVFPVATEKAFEFVGASTLEGLTGNPVFSDLYQPGRQMDHVHLARKCDLAIVCPATANTINQLAAGIGETVIGNLFLAWDFSKPFMIAPAMNQAMYLHPVTQRSLRQLENDGIVVLPTETGTLACGENGPGRLLEPDLIVSEVLSLLHTPELSI